MKLHYWMKKRNMGVDEMNRRLQSYNLKTCPKIFTDPITRKEKEAKSEKSN